MTLQELYLEMEAHLMVDERPSEYLEKAGESYLFSQYPFELLNRMKKTKQSPKYHPEGNVWVHTLMVVNEAAKNRKHSSNPKVFMWSALLHDIGKPAVTRCRKGKITSYNHDTEGGRLAKQFLKAFTGDEAFIEEVCQMVRYHMQILYVSKGMAHAQLDKMKHRVNIREAALLGLCDRMGRLGVDTEKEMESVRAFLQACGETVQTAPPTDPITPAQ